MFERTLSDGTLIEVKKCGRCAGPNGTGGQHFGTSYPYYRINGGLWTGFNNARSQMKIYEWLELCETLADWRELEPE